MQKTLIVSIIVCWLIIIVPAPSSAATIAERASGYILLDVEHNGEAWYVWPTDLKRYYLGRPDDAFAIMRFLSLGITDADLAKIPVEGSGGGDQALRDRLAGRILLQVEQHGEAWYVHPETTQRTYLGRPADAFDIMTRFGLGITADDLARIPNGGTPMTPEQNAAVQQSYTLTLDRGSFPIHVVQLSRTAMRMISETGNSNDCDDNCPAQSLAAYTAENSARYGIHGTYFCPPDYPACANKTYSYLPPFFNSPLGKMLNADALPFHAGPMIVQNSDGTLTFFHRTIDFGYSVAEYELRSGKNVTAAITNYPSLVEANRVIVESEPLESGMHAKAVRGGIGYNDEWYFLVIAQSASVIDLAYIFDSLGTDYAINLDGGGSAALLYDNSYLFGPGRHLPNAIVFKER
ncbi:MAG: phosphodiester glycosidase family protein [bacterium]|nr:phosphodiester glycosidase family protein [bacterium]